MAGEGRFELLSVGLCLMIAAGTMTKHALVPMP